MPCGKTNIPAPKLFTSLPLGSNSSTAGRSEFTQFPPQRSKAQMRLPSRSGVTAMTPPQWRPSGSWPKLTPPHRGSADRSKAWLCSLPTPGPQPISRLWRNQSPASVSPEPHLSPPGPPKFVSQHLYRAMLSLWRWKAKACHAPARTTMQFAIAIPTAADSWRVVRRAEELGFACAWFYDTQMLSADPFVGMAAAAVKTTKIRLGTGVLIPSNRIAPVTANAFASLNKLAPGRIDFGIGTGFTGRRAMGLGAIKLGPLEQYIKDVYGLLAGETIDFACEGERRKIRFLNPELGLINTRDGIPLHLSAFGPRTRALAARLAAGWLNFIGSAENAMHDVAAMREEWRRAGHAL